MPPEISSAPHAPTAALLPLMTPLSLPTPWPLCSFPSPAASLPPRAAPPTPMPQSRGPTVSPPAPPLAFHLSSSPPAHTRVLLPLELRGCSLRHPLRFAMQGGSCRQPDAGRWLLLLPARAAGEGHGCPLPRALPRPGAYLVRSQPPPHSRPPLGCQPPAEETRHSSELSSSPHHTRATRATPSPRQAP